MWLKLCADFPSIKEASEQFSTKTVVFFFYFGIKLKLFKGFPIK